jgi:small subunit ribosomal protein S2
MNIALKDLLDAGVHFGHQIKRWNPRCKPFLFDHRHGVSIINLERTYELLAEAAKFVEETVAAGGKVLFVATKKQSQEIIREAANSVNMPFCVNRWMGGTLTNFATVKTSLQKYKKYLKMEEDGSLDKLPGKEAASIKHQMSRMNRNFEGLLETDGLPAAIFVIDVNHEEIAVREANRLNIPCIGLVDTNSDPTYVTYPIPGNDDATKSIRIIAEVITEAIQEGKSRQEIQSVQAGITPVIRSDFGDETEDLEVTLPEGYEEIVDKDDIPAVEPAPAAEPVAEEQAPAAAEAEAPEEEAKEDEAKS